MESLFLEGLMLQASLILALGAQNLFVLESGLKRQYPLVVSLVCFLCDFLLIMIGVAGAASLMSSYPQFKIIVGLIGVWFLFTYGLGKISFGLKKFEQSHFVSTERSLKQSILLGFTFSILNPHAYLDAFVLIGGYSGKYELLADRLTLGAGAAFFSGLWFIMLSTASSFMKSLLENPLAMRRVMNCSGILLVALSGKLGIEVFGWIVNEMTVDWTMKTLALYPQSPGTYFTTILF